MRAIIAVVMAVAFGSTASAEQICPRYGDCVPADQFECHNTARSSVVKRVCYNEENAYMILQLKSTFYHYCAVDAGTVAEFLAAESLGRFYNQRIKVSSNDGLFDCRKYPIPTF